METKTGLQLTALRAWDQRTGATRTVALLFGVLPSNARYHVQHQGPREQRSQDDGNVQRPLPR